MTRTLLFALALCCAVPALATEPDSALTGFTAWLQRWKTAEPGLQRDALLVEGVKLARARREVMSRLVRTDPAQALLNRRAFGCVLHAQHIFGGQRVLFLGRGERIGHDPRHSFSRNSDRRSQVRIVFRGTAWRSASC